MKNGPHTGENRLNTTKFDKNQYQKQNPSKHQHLKIDAKPVPGPNVKHM